MTTLTIQQGSSTERVTYAIIDKLYRLALTSKVENANSGFTMSLEGSISASHAYLDAVTYLRAKFPNLTISIDDNAYYIRFADSNVEQYLLAANIGDGTGITQTQAASARIDTTLRGKTDITSFQEFKYFTEDNTNPRYTSMFSGCTNLASVDLSECTKMLSSQFYNTAITTVNAPKLQTVVDGSQFESCTSLTTVTSLGSINAIPLKMFKGCTSLQSITLPSGGITTFGNECFRQCSNLSMTASDIAGATSVGNYAFSTVNLTGNVSLALTTIGQYAFVDTNITGLDLSTSTFTTLPAGIVSGCSSLTSISLPSTITGNLDSYTFQGCSSLQTIDLSNTGLTTFVGRNIFSGCSNLKTLTLPSTSIVFDDSNVIAYMFQNCTGLEEIDLSNVVRPQNQQYANYSTAYMFDNCVSLRTLHTNTLHFKTLGRHMFSGCGNLEGELNFPDVLEADRSEYGCQFANCKKLTKITMPNLTSALTFGSEYGTGRGLAYGCTSLKIIDLGCPTQIGSHNFRGGTSLEAVILRTTTPPTMSGEWSTVFGTNAILYVPQSALNTYKTATWFSTQGYNSTLGTWKIKAIETDYNEAAILGS